MLFSHPLIKSLPFPGKNVFEYAFAVSKYVDFQSWQGKMEAQREQGTTCAILKAALLRGGPVRLTVALPVLPAGWMSARSSRKATLQCLHEAVLQLINALFQYYKHHGNPAPSPWLPARTTDRPSAGLTALIKADSPHLASPVQKGLAIIMLDLCSFFRQKLRKQADRQAKRSLTGFVSFFLQQFSGSKPPSWFTVSQQFLGIIWSHLSWLRSI